MNPAQQARRYEAIIKVSIDDAPEKRARDIEEGLRYAAVILIDEYGWNLDRVTDALDEARQEAEDEWYRINPSEGEDPGDEAVAR